MPREAKGEAETVEWIFAALNSVEMVSVPWWFLGLSGDNNEALSGWMDMRLGHIEKVLATREWLAANRFTAADLIMTDVLRIPKVREYGDRPATEAYVARVTSRSAFQKAYADQMAHFAAADEARALAD
jgi:glutathione S-transferase